MSKALQKQLIAQATGKHSEPKFDPDQVLTKSELAQALNFYNANIDDKRKQKWALAWIKENYPEHLDNAKKAPTYSFGTYAAVIRMSQRGFTMNEEIKARVADWVASLGPRVQDEDEEAPKPVRRKRAVVNANMQAFDDLLDAVLVDRKANRVFEVNPKHSVEPVIQYCEKQLEVIADDSSQYPRHMKTFFKDTIKRLKEVGKAVRAKRAVTRKPRKVDPVKMASKVKYMKEEKSLDLKSIKPSDVVGKKKVYLFDTKYRRLTKVMSSAPTGFEFTGTTLKGIDPEKSFSKTVRKPEVLKGGGGIRAMDRIYNMQKGKEFEVASQRMNDNIVIMAVS